jgi:4-carboxymuconolactone decarboxylase
MAQDEEIAYDFCEELFRTKGVSEDTYRRAVRKFGERGVIDIVAVAGYFAMVSMVMNVAHTPPPGDRSVSPLSPFPS